MSFTANKLESNLVSRAQNERDNEAFSRLIGLHQSKVRNFLFRLTRNASDADDIAQDVFLTAYQKLGSYRGTGEFSGWLCSIAYRSFIHHHRKQKREQEIHAALVIEQTLDSTEIDSNRYENISIEQISLEKALQQLPEVQAAAITLCESFGFSHREVAAILELPLGTVKSHINRGKKKLREILIDSKEVRS